MAEIIAHRGGSGQRMENTLAAFAHAQETGASGAELDVHLTADGHVVVHHDDQLNPAYCRDANGRWIDADRPVSIADLTLAELQTFDISRPKPGSDYARRFPHIRIVPQQRIPLLRDVIRQAQQASDTFSLVIEIKTPILAAAAQPWRALVDATLQQVQHADFLKRTILCSFDWGSLLYAKGQCPDLATWFTSNPLSWYRNGTPPARDIPPSRTVLAAIREQYHRGQAPWYGGFAPQQHDHDPLQAITAAGGTAWFPYYVDCTPERVAQAHQLGLAVAAWSVNLTDADALATLNASGADYLCVDYPDSSMIMDAPHA